MNSVKKYFSEENTVYSWWNPEKSDNRLVYKRQEEIVKKIVSKYNPSSIIDVSAGKGRFAKLFHKKYKYTCLDISQQMLNHIRGLNLKVLLVKADVENIKMDKKYDLILCAEALVHYPHPKKALLNIKKLLSNDGILIITTDNKNCFGRILKNFQVYLFNLLKKEKKDFKNKIFFPYSGREYKRMFNVAGLRINKKIYLSLFTTPVKSKLNGKYLLNKDTCKKLQHIDLFFEKIPFINKFCSYFIYVLEKK